MSLKGRKPLARAEATPQRLPSPVERQGTMSFVQAPETLFYETDILALLPEPAREKLLRLREERDTLFLLEGKASEDRGSLTREKSHLTNSLSGDRIDPDDPHVRASNARLQKLNEEIARH